MSNKIVKGSKWIRLKEYHDIRNGRGLKDEIVTIINPEDVYGRVKFSHDRSLVPVLFLKTFKPYKRTLDLKEIYVNRD